MSVRKARIKKLFRIICDSNSIRNSEMNIPMSNRQIDDVIPMLDQPMVAIWNDK